MANLLVGQSVRFDYGDFGTPDNPPDYTAHRGQIVSIVEKIADPEADAEEVEPRFLVRASDGWEGEAFESELKS